MLISVMGTLLSLLNDFGNSCLNLSSAVLSVIKYHPTDNIQLKKKNRCEKIKLGKKSG